MLCFISAAVFHFVAPKTMTVIIIAFRIFKMQLKNVDKKIVS